MDQFGGSRGQIRRGIAPFAFLRSPESGRGIAGRDWRTNGAGTRDVSGGEETTWKRGPEERGQPRQSKYERGGRQGPGVEQREDSTYAADEHIRRKRNQRKAAVCPCRWANRLRGRSRRAGFCEPCRAAGGRTGEQRRGDRRSHGVASNDVSRRIDDPVRLNCNRESKCRRLDSAPDERGGLRVVVSHPWRKNKNA